MRYDSYNNKTKKLNDDLFKEKEKYSELNCKYENLKSILEGTMHEVRRFSGELSSKAEDLNKIVADLSGTDGRIKDLSENIFFLGGMLSARLGFTDIELNPSSISKQPYLRSCIYKKFEKSRYALFNRAKLKNINITFTGNSFIELEAIQAFELLPFVLIENAIKYSPQGQSIDITFDEIANKELNVTIASIGPIIEKDEKERLFNRGFRGTNANRSSVSGEGLGLYLAKSLCDLHRIDLSITASSTKRFDLDGIPYSDFSIKLIYKR
jgi:K+-sensing histidine kinase KdpD